MACTGKDRALTDKQAAFAQEYLVDLNATQAAIRAGYSKSNASQIASQLLLKNIVQKALADGIRKRQERTGINAEYVLRRLVQIDEMDVADILQDNGDLKKISDWPECWRKTINGLDLSSAIIDGDSEVLLKKIKWPDKIKNLELLGRHTDVQAWVDNKNVNHSGELDVLYKPIIKRFDGSTDDD